MLRWGCGGLSWDVQQSPCSSCSPYSGHHMFMVDDTFPLNRPTFSTTSWRCRTAACYLYNQVPISSWLTVQSICCQKTQASVPTDYSSWPTRQEARRYHPPGAAARTGREQGFPQQQPTQADAISRGRRAGCLLPSQRPAMARPHHM